MSNKHLNSEHFNMFAVEGRINNKSHRLNIQRDALNDLYWIKYLNDITNEDDEFIFSGHLQYLEDVPYNRPFPLKKSKI